MCHLQRSDSLARRAWRRWDGLTGERRADVGGGRESPRPDRLPAPRQRADFHSRVVGDVSATVTTATSAPRRAAPLQFGRSVLAAVGGETLEQFRGAVAQAFNQLRVLQASQRLTSRVVAVFSRACGRFPAESGSRRQRGLKVGTQTTATEADEGTRTLDLLHGKYAGAVPVTAEMTWLSQEAFPSVPPDSRRFR